LVLTATGAESEVGQGVDAYWRYEKFIRRSESCIDSTIGASGSIYAIRRRLFVPIPAAIILDDVLIPMQIARQGFRVLFEPQARAYDRAARTAAIEFRRKVRTLAENFQLFLRERWLLCPWANRLWLQTVSHKLCRLVCPLALATLFAANILLLQAALYRWIWVLQLSFYAAAMVGRLSRDADRHPPLVNIAYAFCLLNWATVVGFFKLLSGTQQVTWDRTIG